MRKIFESSLPKGFIDFFETEGRLFVVSAFTRKVIGVGLEVPNEEVADLTEALLRHLDKDTRDSVIESVVNGKKRTEMVGKPEMEQTGQMSRM